MYINEEICLLLSLTNNLHNTMNEYYLTNYIMQKCILEFPFCDLKASGPILHL